MIRIRDELESDFISTRQAITPIKKSISADTMIRNSLITLSFEGVKSISGSFADELIIFEEFCREKGVQLVFGDLSEPVTRMIEAIRKRRADPKKTQSQVPVVPPPPADYLRK